MKALSADTIRILSSSQVITSVVNVVKELLENSLDAGASSVDVKLENYGLDRIEVRDNGSGIHARDTAVMALRHYTSKISSHQDLERLETYGFRGEALGSLCAVAEVVVTTKTAGDDISTQYTLDLTGKVISQKPSHLGQGTTVCALKLFKNLPVRRQFYSNARKCKEELKKVQDVLMAYAIIKPELRVTCTHNKAVVWQKARVSDHRTALLAALGTSCVANLLPLHHRQEQPQITIDGYFPKPGSDFALTSSSNPDRTFIFVNDRPVRDKDLLKVVRQQYNSQAGRDSSHSRCPMLMMSITVPPRAVDVNLTPDKTQVMLHHREAVLSAVEAMLVSLYGPHTSCDPAPPGTSCDPAPPGTSCGPAPPDASCDPAPPGASCDPAPPGTSCDPAPPDTSCDPAPPGTSCDPATDAAPPGSVLEGLWAGPGPESLITHGQASCHRDPRAGTPDLDRTANTSSSSSSDDWLLNRSLCGSEADSSVLLSCAGLSDHASASGPGQDLGGAAAEVPADRWSAGRAFRDRDTGEHLEPVRIHRPSDRPAETESPKRGLNAVRERMSRPVAYDLLSSSAVRQPLTARALFQLDARPTVLLENPKASLQEVTGAVEERWENLAQEGRLKYEERAEKDRSRYALQSQRALERGGGRALGRGGASGPERRTQALKRKAPLSNQTILDQLFSSQPPRRRRSSGKPCRPLPFNMAALRSRLLRPARETRRDPQSLRLLTGLPALRAWVVARGGQLSLFSPARGEEALLFHQLLQDHVLPTATLQTPIPLTDGVLGGAEFMAALRNMEMAGPESGGATSFSDPRLVSNGFHIRLIPVEDGDQHQARRAVDRQLEPPQTQYPSPGKSAGRPAAPEARLEVAGLAPGVPFLGVADLREVLTAIVQRNATSVRQSRPLKIISYLEGEAVRMGRQLPVQLSREAVKDTLSRMQEQLSEDCHTCLHGRPFFHPLIQLPETEQDALHILSNTS